MFRSVLWVGFVQLFAFGCELAVDVEEVAVEQFADTTCKPGYTPKDGVCVAPLLADIHKDIIMTKCKGCHIQKSMGGLLLTDVATTHKNLVGAKPYATGICKSAPGLRVTAGDPDKSLFFTKLKAPSPCGQKMPVALPALPQAQIDQIRAWIEDGAKL